MNPGEIVFAFCEFDSEEFGYTFRVWFASVEAIEAVKVDNSADLPLTDSQREYIDNECEKRGFGVMETEDCADGISRECEIIDIAKLKMVDGVPDTSSAAVIDKKVLLNLFLGMGLVQDDFYTKWAAFDQPA